MPLHGLRARRLLVLLGLIASLAALSAGAASATPSARPAPLRQTFILTAVSESGKAVGRVYVVPGDIVVATRPAAAGPVSLETYQNPTRYSGDIVFDNLTGEPLIARLTRGGKVISTASVPSGGSLVRRVGSSHGG